MRDGTDALRLNLFWGEWETLSLGCAVSLGLSTHAAADVEDSDDSRSPRNSPLHGGRSSPLGGGDIGGGGGGRSGNGRSGSPLPAGSTGVAGARAGVPIDTTVVMATSSSSSGRGGDGPASTFALPPGAVVRLPNAHASYKAVLPAGSTCAVPTVLPGGNDDGHEEAEAEGASRLGHQFGFFEIWRNIDS